MSRHSLVRAAACGLLLVCCSGVCPPGSYTAPGSAPQSGATAPAAAPAPAACILCPLFRFADKPDSPKCTKCAKDTFTRVRGATVCESCPKSSESYAVMKDAVKVRHGGGAGGGQLRLAAFWRCG